MRRLAPLVPALLILLAPSAMLWTLWLNPVSAGEDDLGYYYPLRVLVGQALREGRWPVQNRLEATGAPLMADPQSAVLFPATWLFAALPAPLAYTLSIYIGFSLAGGGAYLYLRRLGLMRTAATFGASAFMFCGFFVGHRVHLGVLHAAAMLPWGLWCIEGLRRRRVVLPWLAPIVFLTLTGGHWPTFIHVCLIWGAYFLLRARPLWRSLGVCVIASGMAAILAAPQILATMDLLREATRQRIGFATAGENSFFPAAAVMAVFPFLMGNRTPNLFSQEYWGPWNQCEMLGYIGLATLALAGAAVWRLYRKPRGQTTASGQQESLLPPQIRNPKSEIRNDSFRPLVRVWTWIAVGAGIWMLGYYLPTYMLVHKIPVLGIVRCPARMVLAVDLALATLAAITIHLVSMRRENRGDGSQRERENASEEAPENTSPGNAHSQDPVRLENTVRRATLRVLPKAMVGTLVAIALAAVVLGWLGIWSESNPVPIGGPREALIALRPWNPAVWAPLATMAATALAVLWWLARPQRRGAVLVAVLLADLFLLTRYVDTQSPVRRAELGTPPEAAWIKANSGEGICRVWGLSDSYFHRQRELLLPKTCCLYDVATITSYGPFQAPAHAHLLGFDIFGRSAAWADLLRRNRLISLYNVRYILTEANSPYEEVLQSVRVTAQPAVEIGPNLVGEKWELHRAEYQGGVWRLSTPLLCWNAEAMTPVVLEPNTIYRISLDARGPDDGAANYLRADVFHKGADYSWFQPPQWGITVPGEQIGTSWRHFSWSFQTDSNIPSPLGLRLMTMSERPIEVRDLALRKLSQWESPEESGGLSPGDPVYVKVKEVPPEDPADGPVVIYRNLLARTDQPTSWELDRLLAEQPGEREKRIEKVRWNAFSVLERLSQKVVPLIPPYAGLPASFPPAVMTRLALETTLPGAALYLLVFHLTLLRARRRRQAMSP